MIIYLLMLIISLLFANLFMKTKQKKYKKLFAFLSALPFFIVSAFRYDVGTDYLFRYVPEFDLIASGGETWNYEVGFSLLNKIIIYFGGSYEWLFIITSIIIIFSTFYFIFKKSVNPVLSILLFFLGGFFFSSMNMIRQFIAMVFCLISYEYLLEKKYFKWLAFLVSGFLFHSSAVVFLIAFLLCKKFIINFKFLIGVSILTLLMNSVLRNIIINLFSMTRFSVYINTNYSMIDVKEFLIFINLIIYTFMYYINYRENNNIPDKKSIFYLNLQGMAIIFSLFGSIFSILSRLVVYFSIFQIISLPYFLSKSSDKNKKALTIILILIFAMNIFYTNVVNNDNGVIPYHTIFER